MTVRTDDLAAETWEVFDEFVNRIGLEDEWELAVLAQINYYQALAAAGLLIQAPGLAVYMYGLTDAGRRAICQRDGHHDHDRNRPADDGCQTCDAALCKVCDGYGSFGDPAGERPDVGCGDCETTGLVQ